VGWLLGVLTPGIVERIRRPYRRDDLTRAVVDEMLGLQYTMAILAHRIRAFFAEASDAFIDEVLEIVEKYRGPDRDENYINALKGSRSRPETIRAEVHRAMRRPNVGLTLKQYSIPLFVAQIGDLAICSRDFQRAVLHIRYHLDLLNQDVISAQSLFDKTFSKPTDEDREALIANQEHCYRDACTRAEIIMRAIGDLQKHYGASE
jgi:hypothetical protein